MSKVKNYIKNISLILLSIIVYLLFISIFYYFEILNYKVVSIINFIVVMVLFFILGFKTSSIERKKGYLNGFIVSSILVLLFIFLSLIFSKLSFSSLVYYLSLILSSIVGGIIGVGKHN